MKLQQIILDKIRLGKEKGRLIPLQFSILEKIKKNSFAFVFDEVGCGKTIEAGIVVWDTVRKGEKKILIVCPSNLVFNWYNEMLSKFGFDFKIIGGTRDSKDLYVENGNCNYYNKIDFNSIANFCIISYDSRNNENSNAALDRLSAKEINWDLIILDEGHESKNEASNRYKTLEQYKALKVLFLSATPIKNLSEDFIPEKNLVKSILGIDENSIIFSPEQAISFKPEYPISRNFKEILMGLNNFKNRLVDDVPYKVDIKIVNAINDSKYGGLEIDSKRGCIFLFNRIFNSCEEFKKVYSNYKKSEYKNYEYESIITFDSKVAALIASIDGIFKKNSEDRIVIFCNHREVVDYLKKMLKFKYGSNYVEAIHGESYETEERKNRIFLLDKNDEEMGKKKIVILSHNIGSVGINLSKFSHLYNYELPYTPADLEQRFGRIDRITNSNKMLSMYIFSDENNSFDNFYFHRLMRKLMEEVLPLLPSKNILFLSKRTIQTYEELIINLLEMQKELKNINDIKDIADDHKKKILEYLEVSITNDRIYDFKNKKEVKLEEMKNRLDTMINTILSNIGIERDSVNENNLKSAIEKFVNSMYNTVAYIDTSGKPINLNFEKLSSKIYNCEEYKEFKNKIQEKDQEIDATIKELIVKYKETKDNEKFVDFLIEEIKKEKINDNMIFSVLYSVWSCLAKVDYDSVFEEFMEIYNERSC